MTDRLAGCTLAEEKHHGRDHQGPPRQANALVATAETEGRTLTDAKRAEVKSFTPNVERRFRDVAEKLLREAEAELDASRGVETVRPPHTPTREARLGRC